MLITEVFDADPKGGGAMRSDLLYMLGFSGTVICCLDRSPLLRRHLYEILKPEMIFHKCTFVHSRNTRPSVPVSPLTPVQL